MGGRAARKTRESGGRRCARRAIDRTGAPSLRGGDGAALQDLPALAATDASDRDLLCGLVSDRRGPWRGFLGLVPPQSDLSANVRDHRGLAAPYVIRTAGRGTNLPR